MGAKDITNKLLVVIAGPTASGKTELSIQLAEHFKTEIICADSRQVYKELNIGVGKPSAEQLARAPHHLISNTSIHNPYSAGHYTTDALTILYALFTHHDVVILSGGTGLYLKSVMEGFDDMPEVPQEISDKWTNIWEKEGLQALITALEDLDPDYLAVVDRDNAPRLIRAAAVSDYAGKPFSAFRKGEKADRPFNVVPVVIDIPRKELYQRIDQRVIDMINAGWLEEARTLFPYRNLKALQTLGYTELFEVIEGSKTLEEAIPEIQQATRRYAKRQLTWFRNQGQWNWVHVGDIEKVIALVNNHSAFKKTVRE